VLAIRNFFINNLFYWSFRAAIIFALPIESSDLLVLLQARDLPVRALCEYECREQLGQRAGGGGGEGVREEGLEQLDVADQGRVLPSGDQLGQQG
jgi:hypothetical protein